MAENIQEEITEKPKKSKKKLLIIIIVAVALLGGAFFGYSTFSNISTKKETKKIEHENTSLIAMDPFVVNLSDYGKYLKMTMQLELSDKAYEELVKSKIPGIRDAVITLLSGKSSDSISGPEGKLQLKDELLLRANQAVGKDVFKNLYFTEFVMQ
jgi:flagellar FliL protein